MHLLAARKDFYESRGIKCAYIQRTRDASYIYLWGRNFCSVEYGARACRISQSACEMQYMRDSLDSAGYYSITYMCGKWKIMNMLDVNIFYTIFLTLVHLWCKKYETIKIFNCLSRFYSMKVDVLDIHVILFLRIFKRHPYVAWRVVVV